MAAHPHDEIFFEILAESGQVLQFLESVFGFLYRRTDFFKLQDDPGDQFGFPPGVAEATVKRAFKQWEDTARQDEVMDHLNRFGGRGMVPPAASEVEITELPPDEEEEAVTSGPHLPKEDEATGTSCASADETSSKENEQAKASEIMHDSESFNGAVRDGYRWSQSISDVDILVNVPSIVVKGKDLKVEVAPQHLTVRLTSGETLVDDDLTWRIKKEETIWSLVPGKHVQIHCEKSQDRWWDSLLCTEAKIDTKLFDTSRPLEEYSETDHMKMEEIVWAEERRKKGLPSREQMATEKILKKSWNQEGSPFKGMPYDPSVVQFENFMNPSPDGV